MYLDSGTTTINGRSYQRLLLRESYREGSKVKHRTIGNLSKCSPEEKAAIKLAFAHKHDLAALSRTLEAQNAGYRLDQGPSVGAVAVLHGLARELGITTALGSSRQGKLALWQVIARALDQGSRLSAVRLAGSHACCELLGLDAFHEDHLYANLAWLSKHQAKIERRLFKHHYPDSKPELFLYDVTSSYLEGTQNALASFGYNRDGKRGKMQIVIGLLCDARGLPLSIEVFEGNTLDPKTMASQVRKVAREFGTSEVTFVGDRGMIKAEQIERLGEQGFHYITAITKPQIRSMLKRGELQLELFEDSLAEVQLGEVRYVLRRNPERQKEMQRTRESKLERLQDALEQANEYLAPRPKASVDVALRKLRARIVKLKVTKWVQVSADNGGRTIEMKIDEAAKAAEAELDGCYVLKTDLPAQHTSKELVHERYKDLGLVEEAFRTSKTVELELRPIHVQRESSTRGHALVVMLAYHLVRELGRRWRQIDVKVQEGLNELAQLCATSVTQHDQARCAMVPEPREQAAELIRAAGISLPAVIRARTFTVATKKKLPSRRKKR